MIENIYNIDIDKDNILFDEPMKKHTSFKIGGNADVLIKINNIEQLKKILAYTKENNEKLTIIGNGSNLLVRDKGIRGIVLKIDIKKIDIQYNNKEVLVTVGAGNKLGELAQYLLKKEITGLEELSGIPGTIGGAIRMNAGAHGKEMKDIVIETTYITRDGKITTIENQQHQFEYRNSIFSKNDFIIIQTTLKLEKGNSSKIKQKMQEYLNFRKEKQPIEYPSAGSTFKRGNDFITAKLIDECGLKGFKIGGAEVSKKHAGFIINTGNATAKDIIELIEYVKKQVYEKFNKNIELELEIIGEE